MSLPRFTKLIINLHAKHPDKNAAKNPTANGKNPTPPTSDGSLIMSMIFNNVSPRIGTNTIRNEN